MSNQATGEGHVAVSDDHRRDSDQPAMPEEARRQGVVGRTPLYAVLSANAVSQVGDMMVAVALPWFVLQTTGSVVQMGITCLLYTSPSPRDRS